MFAIQFYIRSIETKLIGIKKSRLVCRTNIKYECLLSELAFHSKRKTNLNT